MKTNLSVSLLIILSGLFIIFSFFSPLIFTLPGRPDFTYTGGIGDTISGLMGPFIGISGVILTFAAFYIQYSANQIQIKQILNQEKKDSISIFEKNLITQLSFHRENVNDIEILNDNNKIVKGQKAIEYFCEMIESIKKRSFEGLDPDFALEFGKKKITVSAYLFFTFGNRVFGNNQVQSKYAEYLPAEVIRTFIPFNMGTPDIEKYDEGYGIVLSRYFRQLYQIIKYIDHASILMKEEKYYYAKLVRSTLTNAEQILLFYNALSPLGRPWKEEKLITNYKLIKNLPVYAIWGYKPSTWFIEDFQIPKEKLPEYFEIYE